MSEVTENQIDEKTQSLKKLAATVYLMQVLAFAFAGIPLFIGLAINFIKRADVAGTWLESHFNWQVNSTIILLAGLAVYGFTWATPFGLFVLLPVIVLYIYRLVIGWNALNSNKPVKGEEI